jgi:hypothetical protein
MNQGATETAPTGEMVRRVNRIAPETSLRWPFGSTSAPNRLSAAAPLVRRFGE